MLALLRIVSRHVDGVKHIAEQLCETVTETAKSLRKTNTNIFTALTELLQGRVLGCDETVRYVIII